MTANRIIHHIFNQPDLRNVDQASLERLVETYPYFAAARVLLAQKQFSYIPDYNTPVFKKAQLYTSTPQYLHQLTMSASQPSPMAVLDAPEDDIVAKLEAEAEASLAADASIDPDAQMENIVAEEPPVQVLSALTPQEEETLEDDVSAEDQAILDALEAEDRAAADAKTKAEEEAALKTAAEAEAKRIAEEEAAAKAAAEAEAQRIAEEEAAAKAAAEAEAKRIAEEEAAAKAAAEAEAQRIAEEEAAAKAAAEAEAKRIAEEEAAAKAAAEAEAQRIAEEEAAKTAVETERDEVVAVDYEAVEAEIARVSTEDEIVAVDYEAVEAEIARTSIEDEVVAVDYEAVKAEIARVSTEDEIVAVDYEALKPEEPQPQQYEPEVEEEEIVVPSDATPEGPGLAIPKADPETPLVEVATDEDIEEEIPAPSAETATGEEQAIRIHPMDHPVQETELTFQPLYTEDYFAYKKLKDPITAEKMTEKATAEMRSFTDWLREIKDNFSGKSSRDWYHQQLHKLYEDDDPEVTERVEKMAIQSITLNDDIVSETLAEIWIRQHQPEKAIRIYQKIKFA